jgi:hypothetical protein
MIERWTRWVLHHRSRSSPLDRAVRARRLGRSRPVEPAHEPFTLPGTDAGRARRSSTTTSARSSTGSFTLVARTDGDAARSCPRARRGDARREAAADGTLRSARAVSPHVATASIVSSLDPRTRRATRATCARPPGRSRREALPHGQAAIEHDLDPVFSRDLKVGELFIAIPIAVLLLVFVFGRSRSCCRSCSRPRRFPVTLGIVWLFAKNMELSTYTQNMVMLIGLGIAVDYSLLMVYRYREEHRLQPSREEAVVRTVGDRGARGRLQRHRRRGRARAAPRSCRFRSCAASACASRFQACSVDLRDDAACPCSSTTSATASTACGSCRSASSSGATTRRTTCGRGSRARSCAARASSPRSIAAAPARCAVLALQLGPGSNQGIPQNLEAVRGTTCSPRGRRGRRRADGHRRRHGRAGGASEPETRAAKRG